MRTPAIISIAAIGAAAILGGSAVGVSEIVTSHSAQPVAAASPAPTKTIIKKKVVRHDKTVAVPAQNGSAAPASGGLVLRQVSPGVYANTNTSDAFAEAVVSAWDGSPGVQYVYSPVTGQTYAMTYSIDGGGNVTATGGNNVYVQF